MSVTTEEQFRRYAEQAEVLVNGLGDLSVGAIADKISRHLGSEKAVCGHPQQCAVAKYLTTHLGLPSDLHLTVTGSEVEIWQTEPDDREPGAVRFVREEQIANPDHIVYFIEAFDNGEFPDLLTAESLKSLEDRPPF